MMKYLMILCFGLFPGKSYSQASALLDDLQKRDTLYINFCVSPSEFGSVHEGILLYKSNGSVFGKHVVYDYGITLTKNGTIKIDPKSKPIPLVPDDIVKFYNSIKANYFVMKKEWKLDEKQVEYLMDYLLELEKFESKGFSNAPDFYAVISGEKSFVTLDHTGSWDKFLEVKKVMRL